MQDPRLHMTSFYSVATEDKNMNHALSHHGVDVPMKQTCPREHRDTRDGDSPRTIRDVK